HAMHTSVHGPISPDTNIPRQSATGAMIQHEATGHVGGVRLQYGDQRVARRRRRKRSGKGELQPVATTIEHDDRLPAEGRIHLDESGKAAREELLPYRATTTMVLPAEHFARSLRDPEIGSKPQDQAGELVGADGRRTALIAARAAAVAPGAT